MEHANDSISRQKISMQKKINTTDCFYVVIAGFVNVNRSSEPIRAKCGIPMAGENKKKPSIS